MSQLFFYKKVNLYLVLLMNCYIMLLFMSICILLIYLIKIVIETTLITNEKMEPFLNKTNELKYDKKVWYLKMALKVFAKELQLDNEDLLLGKVEIREIPTNTYVMREDSHKVLLTF